MGEGGSLSRGNDGLKGRASSPIATHVIVDFRGEGRFRDSRAYEMKSLLECLGVCPDGATNTIDFSGRLYHPEGLDQILLREEDGTEGQVFPKEIVGIEGDTGLFKTDVAKLPAFDVPGNGRQQRTGNRLDLAGNFQGTLNGVAGIGKQY